MGEEPYYGLAEPPETDNLEEVAAASTGCKACHLWRCGTQTVFGEGPPRARVILVGEQPGDQEDKEGHPFVGPAGRILNLALGEAGIVRSDVYVTNAVKHFKWEPKGARRLHKKPNQREILSCLPWLLKEVELIQPEIVVCLGSTAAQAFFGKDFKVTKHRGEFMPGPFQGTYFITIHPSSILRAINGDSRREQQAEFVKDLKAVEQYLSTNIASRASVR